MYDRGFPDVYRYHRPYRIFWFILGGAAATLWIKYKEACVYDHQWGHCVRVPVRPPPFLQAPTEFPLNTSAAPADKQPQFPRSPQPWVFGNQQAQAQQWEEDKARMLALSRHAGDIMTDLSEAAVDSILSTVNSFKAKLTEHRAQRERQKQLDKELEVRRGKTII